MADAADGSRVHVIDRDVRRRATISRELMSRNFHAEIYEDPGEFMKALPSSGSVLLNEEPSRSVVDDFFGFVRRSGRYYLVSVYADTPTPEQIVRAMRNGAMDYLQWPFDAAILEQSLRRLFDEGRDRLRQERERADAETRVARLTQRERDVLVSLLHGNSNKEVAEELSISPRTVEIYRKNMMEKLSARSASEAARIAIYAGLWEPR